MLGTVVFAPRGALADCPAAPIGNANDLAISFLQANGTQIAPASQLNSSIKRGVVVYDSSDNLLKLCDGTSWVSVGTGTGGGGGSAVGDAGLLQFSDGAGGFAANDFLHWNNTDMQLGVGLDTSQYFLRLTQNNVTFNRNGPSYINQSTVGGSLRIRLSNVITNDVTAMTLLADGRVGIGTVTPHASALLDVASTTQGLLFPRMTAAQRNAIVSPAAGLTIYNTTSNQLEVYNGTAWTSVGGSGSGGMPSVYFSAKGFANKSGGTFKAFNVVDVNQGGAFNNTAGVFTAPKAGVYAFNAGTLPVGSGNMHLYLTKNGVNVKGVYSQAAFSQLNVSDILVLAAGDVVGVAYSGTDSLHTNNWDSFVGYSLDGGGSGGGASTLAGLTDVDVSGVTNGQALVYNASASRWEAGNAGSGGGGTLTGFSAAKGVAQSVPHNTFSTIIFDIEARDDGNNYNPATGTFTAPHTGYYLFDASVYHGPIAPSQLIQCYLVVNSAAVLYEWEYGSADENCSMDTIQYLNAGDAVQVATQQSSGGAKTIPAGGTTHFKGVVLGASGGGGSGGGSAGAAGAEGQIQFNAGGSALGADDLFHWDNTAKRLGVGVDTPASKLEVVQDAVVNVPGAGAGTSYPISRFIVQSGGINRGLEVGAPTGNITSPVYLKVSGTSSRFAIFNENNVEQFTILGNGNIGIGRNAPAHKLDVDGAINATSVLVNGVPVATSTDTYWSNAGGGAISYAGGRVGVGTTSPVANSALHVHGSWLVTTSETSFAVGDFRSFTETPDYAGALVLRRSRGTMALPQHAVSGDKLGAISFGTMNYIDGAGIIGYATQNHSNTAAGTELAFGTTPNDTKTYTRRMTITQDGNVGIGTHLPDMPLTVRQTGTSNYIARFSSSSTSTDKYQGIRISGLANGNMYSDFVVSGTSQDSLFGISVGASSGALALSTQNPEHMQLVITRAGNIGIGTTVPSSKLHVHQATGGTGVNISTSGTGASDQSILNFVTLGAATGGALGESGARGWTMGARGNAYGYGEANDFLMYYWDGTTYQHAISVDSLTRNVGIGTTTPLIALDVAENASNAQIRFARTGSNAGAGYIGANDTYAFMVHGADLTTQQNRLVVRQDGKVGINTNTVVSPLTLGSNVSNSGGPAGNYANYQILLHYGGASAPNSSYGIGMENSHIWFNTGGGFKFYTGGGHTATIASSGAYTQVSDQRLKSEIRPLESALDRLGAIKGVSYVWKDAATRGTRVQIGLIAQDVQAVYPELVDTDAQGMLSVNYAGMVAPLVEAVKTLKAENEALKTRQDDMQSQIDALRAAVDALKDAP